MLGLQKASSIAAPRSLKGHTGPAMLLGRPVRQEPRTLVKMAPPPPANWEEWADKDPAYLATTGAPRYASNDWLFNILTFFGSPIFWRVFSNLVANFVFATAVWLLYAYWFPPLAAFCAGLTTVPHALTGGAIGLLLVFRTNAAYDRFWEARKLWGALVNTVRDCARMAHVHLTGKERDHFLACLGSFPAVLLQHLQKLEPVYRPTLYSKTQLAAVTGALGESDMNLLWKARSRPFALIKMMTAILRTNAINVDAISKRYGGGPKGEGLSSYQAHVIQAAQINERQVADQTLTEFCNQMGAMERIVKSIVPTSYSRHTSRMLSIWTLTLPFVLVHTLQGFMIPVVTIICWMLTVIEEVGHVIEDPFNIHMMIAGSGQEDELRIEASLGVLRGDVFERIPANDESLFENGGNFLTDKEYDTYKFHDDWVKTAT